jgi:ABC-type uncharacterized transport system substrate-binding protein
VTQVTRSHRRSRRGLPWGRSGATIACAFTSDDARQHAGAGSVLAVRELLALATGLGGHGNVRIDYRWANGDINRMRTFAKELVELRPDVILANTASVTIALQRETRTIPIVFVIISDTVGAGLVTRGI